VIVIHDRASKIQCEEFEVIDDKRSINPNDDSCHGDDGSEGYEDGVGFIHDDVQSEHGFESAYKEANKYDPIEHHVKITRELLYSLSIPTVDDELVFWWLHGHHNRDKWEDNVSS